MTERLYRSNRERMLLGVCGGIAQRWGLDPTLVRIAFVALFFFGPGLLVYLIGALVIPREPALGSGSSTRVLQTGATASAPVYGSSAIERHERSSVSRT